MRLSHPIPILAALSVSAKALPPAPIEVFLDQHCYECHDEDTERGDLDLTALEYETTDTESFDLWGAVYDRVSSGEMPPEKKPRPDERSRRPSSPPSRSTSSRASEMRSADGRAELRRLSRVEYTNSLKDLLDLPHLEIEEMLPPDGLAHGFKKSAKALDFSHVMVARYLEVADHALWKAIVPRPHPVERKVIRSELKSAQGLKDTLQTLHVQVKHGTGIPLNGHEIDTTIELYRGDFNSRTPGYVKDLKPEFDGVVTFLNSRSNHNIVVKPFRVQQSGYYKLRVHGWSVINDHGTLKPGDRTETVAFYSPTGRLLGRCDLPPNEPTTAEVTAWLNEGEPVEYLAVSTPAENWRLPGNLKPFRYHHFKANGIALQWLGMEGPLGEQWPHVSHKRLLGDLELNRPTNHSPTDCTTGWSSTTPWPRPEGCCDASLPARSAAPSAMAT